MAWSNFSKSATRMTVVFVMGLVLGCTSKPPAPLVSEIEQHLPKSVGYIRLPPICYHKPPKTISPYVLLAQTKEGKKWMAALPYGKRGAHAIRLTQYAVDNGAFKRRDYRYLPAGKIETTVLNQAVKPYLGKGTWEWEGRVDLKVTELTEIGKTARRLFADLNWRSKDMKEVFEPTEKEFVLYRSDDGPGWQTRSDFIGPKWKF